MLNSHAATPSQSIWQDVSRATFEKHVDKLWKKNIVPKTATRTDLPKQREYDVLPFTTENQFAHDIAVITANKAGARYVTAAAVEQHAEGSGITVRLAGNEGIETGIQDQLTAMFGTLENCANKSKIPLIPVLSRLTPRVMCRNAASGLLR